MKTYKITEEQAQKILNYLSTCPYAQVYNLVQEIIGLQEIKEDKKEIPTDYGTAEEPGI
jgi:hypothetical protein